ncbi:MULTISPECIES: glycogen/starch/alpha-glucan phosphorylase [Clostridiaceae]|uniref:Alpha-1,4 glucan phosphorylase n=1 Tax=Clostridium facile TaxID=2763035 RepID=A0ABR7ITW1_9CLOT|nr:MULTISPECIES: glycogen/starch/alpha-glucan phosphorylase [Clostridiaceae]MBC5788262.1 glycogen/starch/alpha-glucan phosphorylase [Clostridium facile]
MNTYSTDYLKNQIEENIAMLHETTDTASNQTFYKAAAKTVNDILIERSKHFQAQAASKGVKQVNYLSMEFLMGRSLKNSLYNLGLVDQFEKIMKDYDVNLTDLYECEPDAGLGNGGLGRLAACYLDGFATQGYNAYGYSILYEFGIFQQKIVDGWQTELPDNWLPGGRVWLHAKPELAVDVHFGGYIDEFWDNGYHFTSHKNYTTVKAVPYDMYVSGYNSPAVAILRLWKAESPAFDMESFNRGDYTHALSQSMTAEAISKVLYPNDNHTQGKMLRLRQQYFLCAASVADITNRHMREYGTLDNFAEKNTIHINDTHPTLAIPELMRILLDECGYGWDHAWKIVTKTFNYTNHTVMKEALEVWNEDIFKEILPRIYQIVAEINRRFVEEMNQQFAWDTMRIERMAIVSNHQVRMANLCVYTSNKVNGVSKLHSEIIKQNVFHEFYDLYPAKFTNVTNGIAYRRWLLQSNPWLTNLLKSTIGDGFLQDASQLKKFEKYATDKKVHKQLAEAKLSAKKALASYMKKTQGIEMNVNSMFDVQVKRMHEYKRQHLNALNIITDYLYLKENPNADFVPKTYIFGAKAAPGYYMAKQIIKLLCCLAEEIKKDPVISKKLSVVYLENYSVTLSEYIMPASEVSEQISLAGTEASGTGNMKFMLNGAVTLGTMDGANVEICERVGNDNIVIFGMDAEQVETTKEMGYAPIEYYNNNPDIKRAIDFIESGVAGSTFPDIANSLKWNDPYMVLADFDSYRKAQAKISELYQKPDVWYTMAAMNIANAGYFSADRSVKDYATGIWELE